jgi:hypothetical protein
MDASTNEAAAVLAAEHALRRAMVEGDLKTLDDLLAPDLAYLHSSSVGEDKAGFLNRVATKFYNYDSIETRDISVHAGDRVATVDGAMLMTMLNPDGSHQIMNLLFVLVWTRDGGPWRLSYRLATRINSPAKA